MAESKAKPDLPDCTEEEYKGLAGQLFIVGFHGTTPSKDIEMLIREYKVGAIVLFQRNVESADQLRNLVNSLQEIASSAGYKQGLFIAIDQENGLVTRIKPPIAPQLPGAMALGATGDASNGYKIACATSETLKSFGINMNYGPIADVNSEPKNPVIGARSPSDNPEFVGKFVSEQLRGFRDSGMASCVKHFPGHGDTSVDSHYGLPEIPKSMAEIRACELVPFKRAVEEGAESVMTAHIKLTEVSEDLPASLSPFAVDLLRRELGFKGLVVSDCLEMDGVRGPYGTEKAAVLALKAGTNCVMVCHTISAQVGAINLVVEAIKSGELPWKTVVKSLRRLKHLKEKYASQDCAPIPTPSLTTLKLWESRQERLAARVYAKSTTVVRSSEGRFPLPPDSEQSPQKYVFLSPGKPAPVGGAVESGEEKTRVPWTPAEYIDLFRAHRKHVEEIRFQEAVDLSDEEKAHLEEASVIILATRNASLSLYQKHQGLELGKKWGDKLVVIATCDPYDFLDETDIIKNYIAIYEPTIAAFQSALNVMFGITQPSGSLPVGKPTAGIRSLGKQVDYFSDREKDLDALHDLWNKVFADWPIERKAINDLVNAENARHYIHPSGFCLSFLINNVHGRIAVLGVLPEHRGKGIGTSLLTIASEGLRSEASTHGGLKSFCLGSVFPRIWPGVPINTPQEHKEFFVHRGFKRVPDQATPRDLYRHITDFDPSTELRWKAEDAGMKLRFVPLSPERYEDCIRIQSEHFAKNLGWVEAYKKLAEADMHHEAMVAITNQGEQVAWSLMCSPKATPVIKDFAFLPLMPSKEKTGLIACVGVVPHARGKGIASALLTHALEHMWIKHVEGVFIDWVTIRGLYEKSGFQQVFEYEDYVWGGPLDGQPEPDREVSEPKSPEMESGDIQCWI